MSRIWKTEQLPPVVTSFPHPFIEIPILVTWIDDEAVSHSGALPRELGWLHPWQTCFNQFCPQTYLMLCFGAFCIQTSVPVHTIEKHDTSCLVWTSIGVSWVNISLNRPSRQIELHWNPILGSVVRHVYAQWLVVEDGALQINSQKDQQYYSPVPLRDPKYRVIRFWLDFNKKTHSIMPHNITLCAIVHKCHYCCDILSACPLVFL